MTVKKICMVKESRIDNQQRNSIEVLEESSSTRLRTTLQHNNCMIDSSIGGACVERVYLLATC